MFQSLTQEIHRPHRRLILLNFKRQEIKHSIWSIRTIFHLLKSFLLFFSLSKHFLNGKYTCAFIHTPYFRFTSLLWKCYISLQHRNIYLKIFINPKKKNWQNHFPYPFFSSSLIKPGSAPAQILVR